MEESTIVEKTNSSYPKMSSAFASIGSFILESIEAIIIALGVCIVLYLFLITPHEVFGTSMSPNFEDGEYLIANKLIYNLKEPQRGDVVIFEHSATQDYIKRIIGLPGETISIKDGKVYIDDVLLPEIEYLDPAIYTTGANALHEGESYEVPNGEYFVIGDNRPKSSDSRSFGSVDESTIKGRAWIVYFPFSNFRIVEHPIYE